MVFEIPYFTHREPTQLDFVTFFHLVDQTNRNSMLKGALNTPASLYLYSNENQTTRRRPRVGYNFFNIE